MKKVILSALIASFMAIAGTASAQDHAKISVGATKINKTEALKFAKQLNDPALIKQIEAAPEGTTFDKTTEKAVSAGAGAVNAARCYKICIRVFGRKICNTICI
jgi:cell division protein YceG involved in septum cleavage